MTRWAATVAALLIVTAFPQHAVAGKGVGGDAGTFQFETLGLKRDLTVGTTGDLPMSDTWGFEVDEALDTDLWWLVNLSATVNAHPSATSEGKLLIWASVNDRTMVGISLEVKGDAPIRVESANYAGEEFSEEASASFPLEFRNVLQNGSTKPGRAEFRFWVESIGDVGDISVTMSRTSDFELTSSSPFPIALLRGPVRTAVTADGSLATFDVEVSSADGAASDPVQVAAFAATPGLRIVEPTAAISIPTLAEPRRVRFRVALDPGQANGRFTIGAHGARGQDTASVIFEVRRSKVARSGLPMPLMYGAGVLVAAGALAIILDARRRRPTTSATEI